MHYLREFSHSATYKVSFSYSFERAKLSLKYKIEGPIQNLYAEAPKSELREGKDLWKRTCFEAFFFDFDSSTYSELNFNVSGEYCFLYFESYRKEKATHTKLNCTEINSVFNDTYLETIALIELPREKRLLLSPTVILTLKETQPLYFALEHAQKPDFHLKKAIENKAFELLT